MELKKAYNLVSEMIDLCGQLGEESLSDACSGIYNDINVAKNTAAIINSARELMVFVGEAPWSDYDLFELKEEIETIFNNLLEEFEDL